MAKYLFQAKYKSDGVKGLIREGGTARRDNLEKTLKSIGGSLESYYYAFGPSDVIVIADVPDNFTRYFYLSRAGKNNSNAQFYEIDR